MTKRTVEELRATAADLKHQLGVARMKGEDKRVEDLRLSIKECEKNIALRAAEAAPKEST